MDVLALLVLHELPGSSQILDGVELSPLTNHCISNDTFVHDGKLNVQVSVTISSPSSTYAIDGTGTRANGKSIFCETEKKYNTILAYFGIMIIVIIGNSNNDNDNGRFYARGVKVI